MVPLLFALKELIKKEINEKKMERAAQ